MRSTHLSALTVSGWIVGNTSHIADACAIAKLMVEHSEVRVLCSDSRKYGQRGFMKVDALHKFNIVITDSGLTPGAADEIRSLGVRLILV